MKVTEYRELTSQLSDVFADLQSSATPEERTQNAARVSRVARELMSAECKTAKPADRLKAERLIDVTAVAVQEIKECQQ